jgi:hypothetical protein
LADTDPAPVALVTKNPKGLPAKPAADVVPDAVNEHAIDANAHVTTGHHTAPKDKIGTWPPKPDYDLTKTDAASVRGAQGEPYARCSVPEVCVRSSPRMLYRQLGWLQQQLTALWSERVYLGETHRGLVYWGRDRGSLFSFWREHVSKWFIKPSNFNSSGT